MRTWTRVGWDLQVCLPTNAQIAMTVSFANAGLGAALSRAYNNWAHDFCATNPDRLKICVHRTGRRY